MTTLVVMSWIIGSANPLSAILVGPAFARLLDHLGLSRWIVRAQGAGWLVLAVAQTTFVGFGAMSGFPGFKYAQPLMVPAASANFVVWLIAVLRRGWRSETLTKGEVWDALLAARATPGWRPACDHLYGVLISDGRQQWEKAA